MKNTTITQNSFHLGSGGGGGGGGSGGGGCNLGPDMKSACCFAVPSPLSNPLSPVQCVMCRAAAEGYVKDVTRKKKNRRNVPRLTLRKSIRAVDEGMISGFQSKFHS